MASEIVGLTATLCTLTALGMPAANARDPVDFCDPGLELAVSHPLAYRNRPGRCEGIYVREVSADTLHLVSLTSAFDDYDAVSGVAWLVSWAQTAQTPVRLRAEALRRRLHYRMDTLRPPGSLDFAWPIDILTALKLRRAEVGILGWVKQVVEGAERRVYLPLSVGTSLASGAPDRVDLVLVPGSSLREIYLSLAYLGTAGDAPRSLREGDPLGFGYYPAGRGLTIPIEGLSQAGLYRVELGAALQNGGLATVRFWFRHTGK